MLSLLNLPHQARQLLTCFVVHHFVMVLECSLTFFCIVLVDGAVCKVGEKVFLHSPSYKEKLQRLLVFHI